MNKKIVIAAIAVCSMNWTACKKSSSTMPDPVIARGMYAKINGVPWTASSVSYYSSTGGGTNYIEITGYDTSGKTIDLRINNFTKRGTFTIPQVNDSAYYSTDFGALSSPSAATMGTLSVEAVNDTAVGGTFSFSAGGVTVTEGTFNSNFN